MVNEKEQNRVTLMMISDGKTKEYSLSKRTMQGLVGIVGLIIIGMLTMLVQVGINGQLSSSDKAELEALRAKNIEQQEQINVLAQKANDLQADVNRIHALEAEMRQLTNTPTSDAVSRSGLRRPNVSFPSFLTGADVNSVGDSMSAIEYDLKSSEMNLKEMHSVLEERYNMQVKRPKGVPARGQISSHYGSRWGRLHAGLDVANSVGTPIVATAAGVVTMSEWHGAYGYCVTVDHGNGIKTLYGHCQRLLVPKGAKVKKGQKIATMGNTGRSTGPHVHYEVIVNGRPVNPASYL